MIHKEKGKIFTFKKKKLNQGNGAKATNMATMFVWSAQTEKKVNINFTSNRSNSKLTKQKPH